MLSKGHPTCFQQKYTGSGSDPESYFKSALIPPKLFDLYNLNSPNSDKQIVSSSTFSNATQ